MMPESTAERRAARLFGAAEAWPEESRTLSLPGFFGRGDRAEIARDLAASRAALGEAAFEVAFADGRALTLAEAVEYALADPPAAPARGAPPRSTAEGPLSPREREVAGLIAAGRTNRQIAEELVIAEPTADRHVANIFNKLAVHSRAEVAAWHERQRPRV